MKKKSNKIPHTESTRKKTFVESKIINDTIYK